MQEKLIIFYVGVLAGMWAMYSLTSNSTYRLKYKNIYKKHRDVLNWLRSSLSETNKQKVGKRIDGNKVKLIQKIVDKLK